MILRKNLDNRLLLITGCALMAARAVLQLLLDRMGGPTRDFTDFAMGLLFGVGLGCLMLFAWRLGRGKRGSSTGARSA